MPAGRKYRRKPRTKRGRRKPKKSIHHKKRKYAKKKLSSLLYQMKLQAKLNKMSIGNIFYGAKNINEMEQNEGNIKLRDTYSNNELPLLMLSLRSIRNGGNSPSAIMKLQQNGHDFTTVNSVDAMGTSGAISDKQPNSGADYRNLLHRYSQVKLLLWQSQSADTKFEVSLVRLLDPELDPLNTGHTTLDAEIQSKRIQFYKYHQLRAQMSNPLIKNTENFTRDMKRCFKVIWKKSYHMEEQTTLKTQKAYKQVQIFRKFDKVINYCQNPNVDDYSQFDNPSKIVVNDNPDTVKGVPQQSRDNLFLIITANCTRSEDEDSGSFDNRTLDVYMKSKYSTSVDNTFS